MCLSTKKKKIVQEKVSVLHNFRVLSLVTNMKEAETRPLSILHVRLLQALNDLA